MIDMSFPLRYCTVLKGRGSLFLLQLKAFRRVAVSSYQLPVDHKLEGPTPQRKGWGLVATKGMAYPPYKI